MPNVYPVILSGGSGTRLWPVSRALYPKQFVRVLGGDGGSLLGATLRRLSLADACEPPTIICNQAHRFLVKEEVERAGVTPKAIILEPTARNTAPAVAIAALSVVGDDPDGIVAVMPSDHVIADAVRFAGRLRCAAAVATTGRFALFGVEPTTAHTGYGYIRRGRPLAGHEADAYEVEAFAEKPDRATAEAYLAAGGYLWNSGMFVLPARVFLDELGRVAPAILDAARAALDAATADLGFLRLDASAFAKAPSAPVDTAVMEKTALAAVLPIDVGWSDVGSWSSLWDIAPHDRDGNHVHGDVVAEDTTDCFVHSEKALTATLGVKDLVVVATPDAVLVAGKNHSQDVAKVVARLKALNRSEHEQHVRNARPWGYFETLSVGPRFQVKVLHVNPGGRLSLQMHHHRSEHWVVVRGTAEVVVDDKSTLVRENESIYIAATQWHRLVNPGKVPLEVIEVQIGSYLGEDDIVRSDDIYHRSPEETR